MMENNIPFELIAKYLSGQCSEKDKKELLNWIGEKKENSETYEQMKKSWDEIPPNNYEPDTEGALNKVSARLPNQKKEHNLNRAAWLSIAAVLIAGLGLFSIYNSVLRPDEIIEISNNSDSNIDIQLPDGSKVILSKGSELKYPEKFGSDIRKIDFTGEAYFDIEPNKAKPFVIESGMAITKVLGTEFNLKALKTGEVVKVTVTEGLVSLNFKTEKHSSEVKVEVGEVGKLDFANKTVSKEKNQDLNFMAWKDGKLSFENKLLKEALEDLSVYYGKEFIAPTTLEQEHFNGYFDSMTLEEAKNHLEILLDVTITEKGNALVLE